MYKELEFFIFRFAFIRRVLNRILYQFISKIGLPDEDTFLNYGFVYSDNNNERVKLEECDEQNRLFLQLYHRTCSSVDLTDLNVLEVGSGRGGGASFVKRYLNPRHMTGIDFSNNALDFCKKNITVDDLCFVYGDAESQPFDDQTFDAVINIESSHCYGSMSRFLQEVHRILRPNGYLLWADHRPPEKLQAFYNEIKQSGLTIIFNENITKNVVAAMIAQSRRNKTIIDKTIPKGLRWLFYHFSGLEGTFVHSEFVSGKREYLRMVLQKENDTR